MKWKIDVCKTILILAISTVWASVPAQIIHNKKPEKADTQETIQK